MKIWAFVTVWNEELMLPYYLRHYSTFCDKIIVLDNESTDSTLDIAREYPMVEIRSYSTEGTFNDFKHLELKHKCVEESKGKADYIIVSDCDEFIVHPNIKQFLVDNNPDIVYPAGFQMVSWEFPNNKGQIYEEINRGKPDPWYSKPILLNPNKFETFEWIEGCHDISLDCNVDNIIHPVPVDIRPDDEYMGHPWGKWKKQFECLDLFNEFPIKLLHYKFMGAEYVNGRYKLYAERNSIENKEAGLAEHYERSLNENSIGTQIEEILSNSVIVNI